MGGFFIGYCFAAAFDISSSIFGMWSGFEQSLILHFCRKSNQLFYLYTKEKQNYVYSGHRNHRNPSHQNRR